MSNVISREGRIAVGRMYRARFMIAGGLIFSATAFFAGLALLPAYLALHAVDAPSNARSASSSQERDRAEINRAVALLSILSPLVAATTTPTNTISRALSLRSAGVHIDHITYTTGEGGTIVISGTADTPTKIDAYRKSLSSEPMFTSVSVPVGDLVGAKGGHFSVTLQGTF